MKPRKPRKMWANIGRHFIQLRLSRQGALEAEEQEEHSEAEAVAIPVLVLDLSLESVEQMMENAAYAIARAEGNIPGITSSRNRKNAEAALSALGLKADKKKGAAKQ